MIPTSSDATPDKPAFEARPDVTQRLADTIAEAIAEAMFDGRIKPGDPLPSEGEIAETFSVSKPVAREALRQLTGAGLVHTQQGKVARARALSGEPFARIYGFAIRSNLTRLREANEMRRVIETGIARLAAQRRVEKGLVKMAEAVAAMHRTLQDPDGFTLADIAFHHGMAMATGNTMIRVQVESMRAIQEEVSSLFSRRSSRGLDDWRATVVRHEAILAAIRAGDAGLAEAAMIAHFEAADIASLQVADETGMARE
jgi:GntR family transcriptional repressor for pyruvate dehydrogenase complex